MLREQLFLRHQLIYTMKLSENLCSYVSSENEQRKKSQVLEVNAIWYHLVYLSLSFAFTSTKDMQENFFLTCFFFYWVRLCSMYKIKCAKCMIWHRLSKTSYHSQFCTVVWCNFFSFSRQRGKCVSVNVLLSILLQHSLCTQTGSIGFCEVSEEVISFWNM